MPTPICCNRMSETGASAPSSSAVVTSVRGWIQEAFFLKTANEKRLQIFLSRAELVLPCNSCEYNLLDDNNTSVSCTAWMCDNTWKSICYSFCLWCLQKKSESSWHWSIAEFAAGNLFLYSLITGRGDVHRFHSNFKFDYRNMPQSARKVPPQVVQHDLLFFNAV